MLEKETEMKILDRLNKEPNTIAMKYSANSAFDPQRGVRLKSHRFVLIGMSDIIVLTTISGMLIPIFMEVKNEKGRQSDVQRAVEKKLTSMGGYYKVVRSVDEALKFLDFVRESVGYATRSI